MFNDACSMVPVLSLGLYYEPVIHPKPGGVTLLYSHGDKSIYDFIVNAVLMESSLAEACRGKSIGLGLATYRVLVERFRLKSNIALGSLILHLPLSVALGRGVTDSIYGLVSEARKIVESTGESEAIEYYRLLEYFKPSHLGVYYGIVPSIGSGYYPKSFLEVLRVASWDIVHKELVEGYPITLETLSMLWEYKDPLEIKALKVMLILLARHGDTLIASKFGYTAYKKARIEAGIALEIMDKEGVYKAIEWLDSLWRPRGWNPGAILDIIATAISLYNYSQIIGIRE
ncbi:MAG: triphosphoribosyl-dephospho-CoA synthase [Acidilobaceae archaeon]